MLSLVEPIVAEEEEGEEGGDHGPLQQLTPRGLKNSFLNW